MKCQNCGRNEVNFHYSSNINGCVTETSLCSECAAQEGYDIGSMFDTRNFFGMNSMLNPGSGQSLIPRNNARDLFGFGDIFDNAFLMLPFTMRHGTGMMEQAGRSDRDDSCSCGCGRTTGDYRPAVKETNTVPMDIEMAKRRELNMQMRAAVEKEDFEKAAQLRDMIRGPGAQKSDPQVSEEGRKE